MKNLREMLSLHEGRKPEPYKDSLGLWTIGVGHLIDARKGGSLFGVKSIPMTEENIDLLLDEDVRKHRTELWQALPWIHTLSPVRQDVLTDMAFNLGAPGLLKFKNTLAAVHEGRWADAKAGMLNSAWAGQVGSRATRLADMMLSGVYSA